MSDYELLIKLFDNLKDALKDIQQLCHAMLTNQQNMGNYMKTLPMTDLKEALKEHSKEASDDIGVCTETVATTSGDVLKELKIVTSKINRMILVVIVAFTIMTGGFFIIRSASDSTHSAHSGLSEKRHEELEEIEMKKIMDSINDLRKTIEKYHKP